MNSVCSYFKEQIKTRKTRSASLWKRIKIQFIHKKQARNICFIWWILNNAFTQYGEIFSLVYVCVCVNLNPSHPQGMGGSDQPLTHFTAWRGVNECLEMFLLILSRINTHTHTQPYQCTGHVDNDDTLTLPCLISLWQGGSLTSSLWFRGRNGPICPLLLHTEPQNISRYIDEFHACGSCNCPRQEHQVTHQLFLVLLFIYFLHAPHKRTYRKFTQPVPGGGAIQTKLKLVEGWWLTWEATTLQTNWVPANWRSDITPGRERRE